MPRPPRCVPSPLAGEGQGGGWCRRLCALAAALFLALLGLVVPAAGPTAALSGPDRADVERVENYLNAITTLEARFLQVASTGGYSEGKLYLSRPGKLRIEYDPPVPVLMVSGGGPLIYYDKELEQVSFFDIETTPAGYLVRAEIALSGDIKVTGVERGAGVLRVTLIKAEDPHEGRITLVFSDKPLSLRKWIVTDAQGVETTVSLTGVRTGVAFDADLFRFKDPRKSPLGSPPLR